MDAKFALSICESDCDLMRLAIARRLARIETQHVLAAEIIIDGLKHRGQIVLRVEIERGFRIANSEVAPAGLFGQFAKAFGWRTRHESPARREELKMNYVKGNAAIARRGDHLCIFRGAERIQAVAHQQHDPALHRKSAAASKRTDRGRRAVENRGAATSARFGVKCRLSRARIGCEWHR